MRVTADGFVPKERYTSREFLDREMEGLWSRVWQVACREEELGAVGDYVEYVIGDQSILVVRSTTDDVQAYFNACLHRGTRLADGAGNFADGTIRCRYHAWRYELDGRIAEVVDRDDFGDCLPDDLRLGEVRCERWGGFVFVNLDPDAEPLLDFLAPLPDLLAPYRFEDMRLRGSITTILPANWKVVVDAFNEAYHVQGTHPQLLPWTDDVSIEYEQLGKHAHYGRLPNARRLLRPSPRLGLAADEVDEGAILRGLVERARRRVPEGGARPRRRGDRRDRSRRARRCSRCTSGAAWSCSRARGLDVSGFTPDQMTSADDVYWFPNIVGPVYPGSAILFRGPPGRPRPRPRDPRHVGARVAPPGRRVADARATLVPRLGGTRLGRDHDPGLLQHGARPDRHEVTRLPRRAPQPPPGEQRAAHAPRDRRVPGNRLAEDRSVEDRSRDTPN